MSRYEDIITKAERTKRNWDLALLHPEYDLSQCYRNFRNKFKEIEASEDYKAIMKNDSKSKTHGSSHKSKVERKKERYDGLKRAYEKAKDYYTKTPQYETERLGKARDEFNKFMETPEFKRFLWDQAISKRKRQRGPPPPKQYTEYVEAADSYGNAYYRKCLEFERYNEEAQNYAKIPLGNGRVYHYKSQVEEEEAAAQRAKEEALELFKRYNTDAEAKETNITADKITGVFAQVSKAMGSDSLSLREIREFIDNQITPKLIEEIYKTQKSKADNTHSTSSSTAASTSTNRRSHNR